jgi:hypothetical protein
MAGAAGQGPTDAIVSAVAFVAGSKVSSGVA